MCVCVWLCGCVRVCPIVQVASVGGGSVAFPSLGVHFDVSNGTWLGTPVFASRSPTGTPGTMFTMVPVPPNPDYFQIVHTTTGLCVDAVGVPYGQSCLHPGVRALPYCDQYGPPALPLCVCVLM